MTPTPDRTGRRSPPSVIGAVGLEIESHLVDLDSVAERVAWDRVDPLPGAGVRRRRAVRGHPGAGRPVRAVRRLRRRTSSTAVTELAGMTSGPGRPWPGCGWASPRRAPTRSGRRGGSTRAPLPGDGAALRGHRPGRVGRGDDELDRRHAGQPAGRAGTRLAGAGGPRAPARADAGGHLGELALAVRARHRVEVGPAAGLGRVWTRGRAGRCPAASAADPAADCRPRPGRRPGPATPCAPRWPSSGPRRRRARPCAGRVPFEQWASGEVRLGGRSPTAADLDVHLTTLFPPVRLRGYLELRYLDMTASAVVAGHRRGRHHADGRPGRGRPGHRGNRASRRGCGPRRRATASATPCSPSRPAAAWRIAADAGSGRAPDRRRRPGRAGRVRSLSR